MGKMQVRIDRDLVGALKKSADANRRSLQGEVNAILAERLKKPTMHDIAYAKAKETFDQKP